MPDFVDSNVLVYARDPSVGEKHTRALGWMDHLWTTRTGRVSVQVLNEFYVTVTRKLSPGLSRERARSDIRDLARWRPVVLDESLLVDAWDVEDRFGLSFWDALIFAAAKAARCERLLTEDLQAGQLIDGVTVTDPFAIDP